MTTTSPPTAPAPSLLSQTWRRLQRILLVTLLISLVLLIGYTYATLHVAYSDGERAGVLQKLSHKGWICKTWEGELLLTPLAGTVPEKFYFTVPDEAVARKLNDLLGKSIALSYEQHLGIPSNCFGDTEYFVQGFRPL